MAVLVAATSPPRALAASVDAASDAASDAAARAATAAAAAAAATEAAANGDGENGCGAPSRRAVGEGNSTVEATTTADGPVTRSEVEPQEAWSAG